MWKYKTRIIRVGKSWVDDEGTKHPYNWITWDWYRKQEIGIAYIGDPNGA